VTDEQRAAFEPIDPAQWRALTLEMAKEDGGRVYLDLEDLGAVGEARVVDIAPCPPVEGDPASPAGLITGLFRHESGEVVDVHIAGLDEPIGTTANHPFWSEDQQTFVPASALGVGEQVRTLAGLAHVTSVTARGPPEAVYNLEVHGEHVYQVTSLGVLVHNACNRHHPLPKFLGGDTIQDLEDLAPNVHREFHRSLAARLKQAGIPLNVGGRGGSAADWARYMTANPGSQRKAFDAVLDASRQIDQQYGTSITEAVWRNVMNKAFTQFP
jgi:hypothetical protein